MEYKLDKRTGNELSVLGMGCMRLPRGVAGIDIPKTELMILTAFERGINYFDTAYAYGGSEEAIGEIFERNNLREHVHIATKLPHTKCKSIDDVERLFSTSLERLRTDYVDYYLIHNVVTADQWTRLVDLGIEEWIARKKESGAIRRIGFSFHGGMAEFRTLMESYDWDLVQIQYNYVNEHYQAGREGIELAASKGIPVVVMEPVKGGLLADPPQAVKDILDADMPNDSYATAALRFSASAPGVFTTLSGMNTIEQVQDNCAAFSDFKPLNADEQNAIKRAQEAMAQSGIVPCTGCDYCAKVCPQGIGISGAMTALNYFINFGDPYAANYQLGFVVRFNGGKKMPSECIQCGKCEEACPQGIKILDCFERIEKEIVPFSRKNVLMKY